MEYKPIISPSSREKWERGWVASERPFPHARTFSFSVPVAAFLASLYYYYSSSSSGWVISDPGAGWQYVYV
jgi:hypothetical protein